MENEEVGRAVYSMDYTFLYHIRLLIALHQTSWIHLTRGTSGINYQLPSFGQFALVFRLQFHRSPLAYQASECTVHSPPQKFPTLTT